MGPWVVTQGNYREAGSYPPKKQSFNGALGCNPGKLEKPNILFDFSDASMGPWVVTQGNVQIDRSVGFGH